MQMLAPKEKLPYINVGCNSNFGLYLCVKN